MSDDLQQEAKFFRPELGQMIFNTQAWGIYPAPEFVRPLVKDLIHQYATVFWNINQTEFDENFLYSIHPKKKLEIPGLELHPYYWGEDNAEAERPNFAYDGIHVRWYKHMGRSMSVNIEQDSYQWTTWYQKVYDAIWGYYNENKRY